MRCSTIAICAFTNNLNVANTLMAKEDFRIILAGGELRSRDGGIILAKRTSPFHLPLRPDSASSGSAASTAHGSLLEFDYHEVRTKRAIIDIPPRDSGRRPFDGCNAMVNMGSISLVDAVFTDVLPPPGVMQVLTDHHIQLELC
ncbi:hypothetical protein ACNKHQ_19845 [Shigella flexneri]